MNEKDDQYYKELGAAIQITRKSKRIPIAGFDVTQTTLMAIESGQKNSYNDEQLQKAITFLGFKDEEGIMRWAELVRNITPNAKDFEEKYLQKICRAITIVRSDKKLSLDGLGVSIQTVKNIEAGQTLPTQKVVNTILAYLGFADENTAKNEIALLKSAREIDLNFENWTSPGIVKKAPVVRAPNESPPPLHLLSTALLEEQPLP